MAEKKARKKWDGTKFDNYEYSALDAAQTARVYEALLREDELKRPEVKRLYQVHTELSRLAARMYRYGVYVHQDTLRFQIHCLEQEIVEKRDRFLSLVGLDGMRCTDDDMRALLYQRHERAEKRSGVWVIKVKPGIARFGLPDPLDKKSWTDESRTTVSIGADALLLLLSSPDCPPEAVPIIDAFWEAKEAMKRRSFLVSTKLIDAIGPDGRLRPGWNSCGTDTMRFSCRDPNVMQMEQVLRHVLGAAPGRVLVHGDKSQLELRVMAQVAPDTELQRRLNIGDVYGEDAKDWFKLPRDMDVKKTKPKARQTCKIVHLASQYGAGVVTIHVQVLQEDRSAPFHRTALLHKGFQQTYPGTVDYWAAEKERVGATGYSEGRVLKGRRYYARMPDPSEINNYPIQRTAAEMMNLETLELDRLLRAEVPDAHIVMQLHDAVDVDCTERDTMKVLSCMERSMHKREYNIDGRTCAYPMEFKVSNSWGDV